MISDATTAPQGANAPDAPKPIALPRWMNERRQRCMVKLIRFAWGRPYGRLCLTRESAERLCRDADLLPHELDRALDDLSAIDACAIRGDGITDYVTFNVDFHGIAWRAHPRD